MYLHEYDLMHELGVGQPEAAQAALELQLHT
jgi:hypothetical protein